MGLYSTYIHERIMSLLKNYESSFDVLKCLEIFKVLNDKKAVIS